MGDALEIPENYVYLVVCLPFKTDVVGEGEEETMADAIMEDLGDDTTFLGGVLNLDGVEGEVTELYYQDKPLPRLATFGKPYVMWHETDVRYRVLEGGGPDA
jgi:hypothetical protein